MTFVMSIRQWIALILLVAVSSPPAARATTLDDARDAFREADFEMALGILSAPLEDARVTGAERRDALALAAQCHARLDREDEAVKDLCDILAIEPRWQPDPTAFSPAEMRLFRVALATCPPDLSKAPPEAPAPLGIEPAAAGSGPKWYERRLVWIGAGAVAITAAWLLGGDDSGGGTGEFVVPGFPDPPSSAGAP